MAITHLLKQLDDTRNIDEINQVFQQYSSDLGIKAFAFTYYSLNPSSRKKLKYEYASPSIKPWHNYYLESGYEDIDQTLQWARQAILPVFWDVNDQLKQAKTEREKELRQESLNFGIERGFSIPIHGPQQDFAVLAIYQMKGEKTLDPNFMYEWVSVAYYLYAAIRTKLQKQKRKTKSNKYELTPREMQCLKLTAENYLAKDIAKIISITERTVHYHLQNANKKIGTKHKYQAVAKVIAEGLMS